MGAAAFLCCFCTRFHNAVSPYILFLFSLLCLISWLVLRAMALSKWQCTAQTHSVRPSPQPIKQYISAYLLFVCFPCLFDLLSPRRKGEGETGTKPIETKHKSNYNEVDQKIAIVLDRQDSHMAVINDLHELKFELKQNIDIRSFWFFLCIQ